MEFLFRAILAAGALHVINILYLIFGPHDFVGEPSAETPDEQGQCASYCVTPIFRFGIATWDFLEHNDKPILAVCTIGLLIVTWSLAYYTWGLFRATVALGRDAKASGVEQADKMAESIGEASRAATAMEKVATATENNATLMTGIMHTQIRAYIAVDVGDATYQDANLNFAFSPVMTNTGFTPARNVSYKAMADILDLTPDGTHVFEDPKGGQASDAVLSPRQKFVITAVVDRRLSDTDVAAVMRGETKRLFVWGTVTYDDIFGNKWETNFCHNCIFLADKENKVTRVNTYYYRTHNSAT